MISKIANHFPSKFNFVEKYFSEIVPFIIFFILLVCGFFKENKQINMNYANNIITIISILLIFYLRNMVTISNAKRKSIIGNLHPKTQKRLYKYNSTAILYSILIIADYFLINIHTYNYYLFIILVFSNICSVFRIYCLMNHIAKLEINKRIKNHKEYF